MPDAFPTFRQRRFPQVHSQPPSERFRGSARDRGYDARWDKISKGHRRKNPFCVLCEQQRLATLADDVDHIVPLEDGGLKYDPLNRWSICRRHHNGWKARAQRYARKHGMLDELRRWCLEPETRPPPLCRVG